MQVLYEGSPRVFLTILFAILLNSSLFSLHMIAASTLAPLSSLGSEKGYLIKCQSSRLLRTNKSILTSQHRDDTQQDLLYTLHWTPSFSGQFIAHGIISRCVQDRNADTAIGKYWKGRICLLIRTTTIDWFNWILTVWVEHLAGEFHLRWTEWVIRWEDELRWEDAALETSSLGATKRGHYIDELLCLEDTRWVTYVIRASHSKKLSSVIGPATIPSGGFKVNSMGNGDR